jgi:hypothetical protein
LLEFAYWYTVLNYTNEQACLLEEHSYCEVCDGVCLIVRVCVCVWAGLFTADWPDSDRCDMSLDLPLVTGLLVAYTHKTNLLFPALSQNQNILGSFYVFWPAFVVASMPPFFLFPKM